MGIFTGLFGADTATKAAKDQLKEARAAQQQSLGFIEPYAAAGKNALTEYLNGIGLGNSQEAMQRFQASPEYLLNYQTALDEGRLGVGNVAQGTGTFNSGRTLKALQDRARQTTSGFYDNYLRKIAGVTDTGYNAAGAKANIRMGGSQAIQAGIGNVATAKLSTLAGFDSLLDTAAKAAGAYFGAVGSGGGGTAYTVPAWQTGPGGRLAGSV